MISAKVYHLKTKKKWTTNTAYPFGFHISNYSDCTSKITEKQNKKRKKIETNVLITVAFEIISHFDDGDESSSFRIFSLLKKKNEIHNSFPYNN